MRKTPRDKLAMQRFYALAVMLVLILILIIGSVVLWIITPRPAVIDPQAPFAVQAVTLEGNTKYREDAVIGISGVVVGQNIFSVNTSDVEQKILTTFPYFETVDVRMLHLNEVHITVTEGTAEAAMAQGGNWLVFSHSGRILESREITGDRPGKLVTVKGADPPENTQGDLVPGNAVMNDYCLSMYQTLMDSAERYALNSVTAINLSDKNDLQLTWDDRIVVRLGNSSNLEHEIGVVAVTIPKILSKHGQNASGVLNVSSYSNDALENQAIFTPQSLLPTQTTASRRPAPGETTAAPSDSENGETDATDENSGGENGEDLSEDGSDGDGANGQSGESGLEDEANGEPDAGN